MTNKVKPFFIRTTDDMTPQMVQDAFDKCHKLGVRASNNDDVENLFDLGYFGVCARDGTYLSDSYHGYFDAQEITLDQLDEWLGLEVEDEKEWKNGDECMIRGEKLIYIGESIEADIHCVQELDSCIYRNAHMSVIEKPETPKQKAERERLEAVREMFLDMGYSVATWESYINDSESCGIEIEDLVINLGALCDAGYRKQ